MDGLWRWDIDTFRAIHLAGRDLVADPFLQVITNMGLAHIQGFALLAPALRSKLPSWGQAVFIAAALAISWVAEMRGIPGAAAFGLCLILFWRLPSAAASGAFAAAMGSGILRIIIEAMVNRQRPSNFDFARPLEPVFGHSSFPSGHAATSMAISIFLLYALRGHDRPLAWIALGWGVIICLSRIAAGVHYPLDIIGGTAVALVGASVAWLWWERKGWLESPSDEEGEDEAHSVSQ